MNEENREFLKLIGIILAIIIIPIMALSFIFKWWDVTSDRIIFKESITYNEGVLDDLAKYKLEMIQAKTAVEKIAIANLVVDRFANYDEKKIESDDLKEFLKDCRNLDLGDY